MSYRSKRTRNGDQANPSTTSAQPSTHPLPYLQREERQTLQTKQQEERQGSVAVSKITKPVAKKTRSLTSNEGTDIRLAEGINISTLRNQASSTRPHVEERPNPTKGKRYAFPPHLDPSYIKAMRKSRAPISADTLLKERSQEQINEQVDGQGNEQHEEQENEQVHEQENEQVDEEENELANIDVDPLEQRNEQHNSKKSKSTRPRNMKSRSVPDWSEPSIYDPKEDVMTIDAEQKQQILTGSIHPRDVDHFEDGVRCIVHFNDLNQPLRRAGCVLTRYLGWLAKLERYCPIGVKSWHEVNNQFKADIVTRVRGKFVIPDGTLFNKAILMRVGKNWRNYRHDLKLTKFKPDKRTKEQIMNDVPLGHTKDNWIRLVEYWYSEKSQRLSRIGKQARQSQTHVHTTCSTSYADKRADFVESKGKEPSHIEFFRLTHTKTTGGFVDNTLTSQLLEEANSKVQELVQDSSPSKSRVEIENEVFDKLMYEDDLPKRPIGFGYGVKQSQVFGVQGILKKGEYMSTSRPDNSTQFEIMKAKVSDMEKENQELRSKIDKSNERVDQILLQTLQAIRSGKISDEVFNSLEAAISKPSSQVASAGSGNNFRNGLDDQPSSSNS